MSEQSAAPIASVSSSSARMPPRALGLGVVLLLGVALMALGCLPPWLSALFSLGSAVTLGVGYWVRRREGFLPMPLVSAVFLLLSLWTLAQCIPLPFGVLSKISPAGAQAWLKMATVIGDPAPDWAPISLAPSMTLVEAAKWGAYAGLSWLGVWWGRYRGANSFCWAVVALALTLGVVTGLHGLFNASTIFGIYHPENTFPRWVRGPLLNVNNLSTYLSLGFYAAVGLLQGERLRTRSTALLLVAAVTLVVGVLALASRAAVASLLLGGLLMPLVLSVGIAAKKRQKRTRNNMPLIVTAVLGVGALLAFYGFRNDIVAGLGERNWSKIKTALDSLSMIRDYPLTGIGRGAFEGAFFRYKRDGIYEFWTYPENVAIQWFSEWGVPVVLAAMALFALALWRSTAWREAPVARVLLLGLSLTVVHDLFDYSLEIAAIGGLAAVWLGVLVGLRSGHERRRSQGDRPTASTLLAPALAVFTAAASIAALAHGPDMLHLLRKRALSLTQQVDLGPEAIEPIRVWLRSYPTDPHLPLAAGRVLSRTNPRGAMRWLGLALDRGPNLGPVHMGISEALARAGIRQQAMFEARTAIEHDPSSITHGTRIISVLAHDVTEMIDAAPRGPSELLYLDRMAAFTRDRPDIQEPLRQHILLRNPCALWLQQEVVTARIRRIESQEPPCSDEAGVQACRAEVEEQLKPLVRCPGSAMLLRSAQSDLLWSVGEKRAALDMLEESCASVAGEMSSCLGRVAERAAEVKDNERLRRVLRIVVSRRCQEPVSCGQAWSWASQVHERAADLPSALVDITKATEQNPADMALRQRQIIIAQRMGAYERAEVLTQQILSRHPGDPWAHEKIEELRRIPRSNPAASSSAVSSFPRFPPRFPR